MWKDLTISELTFFKNLHKKEIGEEYYTDTIELLVELIAKVLVIERMNKND